MGNSVLKSPCQGFTFNLLQSFHQLYTRNKIFATTRKIAGNPPVLCIGSLVEVCFLIFEGHLEA